MSKCSKLTVGLHDADGGNFPNYALMKISAYHKAQGDSVEWWMPIKTYDRVYSNKIFTFTPENMYLPQNTIKGGTGYGIYDELPHVIDDVFPDYSIYPKCDYAIGFITRGCIRKCSWCVVPRKEGMIRAYRTWKEIKRPDSNKIVLMDNNILASEYGKTQLESMIGENVKIDCNQGLDARLIDDDVARILSKLQWIRFIRMSCDTDEMLETVIRTIERLGKFGVKAYRIFVYLLVTDVKSAENRAIALKKAGVDVFAQPYRDFENNTEPTNEQKAFARYVNRKEIFKSIETFAEYKRK